MEHHILVTIPHGEVMDTFFPADVRAELEALGTVSWNPHDRQFTPTELAEAVKGVDTVFTGWGVCPFSQEVLASAGSLEILAHTGGSVAAVATQELYQAGVQVLSGNEIYAQSVAEGVVAYMLMALRRLPNYLDMMCRQGWHSGIWQNQGLLGKRVGVIEFGAVARALVELLRPFGVQVVVSADHLTEQEAAALNVEKSTTEEIFRTCPIVTLHGALTEQTRHSITGALLAQMPQGSLFINTARGALVEEQELAQVLAQRPDMQAVLDVYEHEPLPLDSPLRQLPNAYLIPHMAGPTMDRRPAVTRGLIRDVQNVWNGVPAVLEINAEHARRMSI